MPRKGRPSKYAVHMAKLENGRLYSITDAAYVARLELPNTPRSNVYDSIAKVRKRHFPNVPQGGETENDKDETKPAWFGWRWKAFIPLEHYANPTNYHEVQALNDAWEREQWEREKQGQECGQQEVKSAPDEKVDQVTYRTKEPEKPKPESREEKPTRRDRRWPAWLAVASLLFVVQWPRVEDVKPDEFQRFINELVAPAITYSVPPPSRERISQKWKTGIQIHLLASRPPAIYLGPSYHDRL